MIIPFTPTLLPAPVMPATRRWGIRARSATTGFPSTSMPRAIVRSEGDLLNFSLSITSRSEMRSRFRFGTSMPIAARPGIRSMRTFSAASARARSFSRPDDLRHLDARRGLELVGRDDRPGPVAVDDALDAELEALGGDELHRLLELLARLLAVPLHGGAEELLGREDPAVRLLGGGEREDPLRRRLRLLQLRGPRHRDRARRARTARAESVDGARFGPGGEPRTPAARRMENCPEPLRLADPERREGGDGDDLAARLLFLVLDRRRLARPLEVLLDHRPPRPLLLLDLPLPSRGRPSRPRRSPRRAGAVPRIASPRESEATRRTPMRRPAESAIDRAGRVEGGDERPGEEVAHEAAGAEAAAEELGAPEARGGGAARW